MGCDPKSFDGVTPQVFDALKGKLQSIGFNLPGERGTINGPMGIVMDYDWDRSASTLHTQVTNKNFLVPCSRIYSELSRAIEDAKG
jgi:hypothetical protein